METSNELYLAGHFIDWMNWGLAPIGFGDMVELLSELTRVSSLRLQFTSPHHFIW
jgi:hypothetical protein